MEPNSPILPNIGAKVTNKVEELRILGAKYVFDSGNSASSPMIYLYLLYRRRRVLQRYLGTVEEFNCVCRIKRSDGETSSLIML